MTVSEIALKMIKFSNGNKHDINHFLKVYSYALTIGKCENISNEKLKILEIAALVHDIACPLCREKYGNTNGKNQEKESTILVNQFLQNTGLLKSEIDRISFLVSHHHTYNLVDDIDYQILLEADYLVNADESEYSIDNIKNTLNSLFKTNTGSSILKSVYNIN